MKISASEVTRLRDRDRAELARLRAENARLREACRDLIGAMVVEDAELMAHCHAAIQRARAALANAENKGG